MDIKSYNCENKIQEKNISKKLNENQKENYIKKISDNNTTNEDDSIYITDEVISYCSSPKSGLVSIKKTKYNNSAFNTFINLGNEICNINNTITLNISMLKKEVNLNENKADLEMCNMSAKYISKEKLDCNNTSFNSNNILNHKESNQNDKEKENKIKSIFKKKNKKTKENDKISNEEINKSIKKKLTKGKKKKTRKFQNEENKIYDPLGEPSNVNKDLKKIKEKNKTQKLNKINDIKKKLMKKKYEIEEKKNEIEKEKEEEYEDEQNPNIIILDFSSSAYSKENEEKSDKEKNCKNTPKAEKLNEINNNDINKNNTNFKFNKLGENDFLNIRHKTIIDISILKSDNKIDDKSENKLMEPKSKNSCFLINSFRMSQNKIDNSRSNKRRMSVNYRCSFMIRRKSNIKLEENKKYNKKEKKKKQNEEFSNIFASKNNENENNKILNTNIIKENFRKSTKLRTKNKINEKFYDKDKEKDKILDLNGKIDNNKNSYNTPNKKFRHLISHNYDVAKRIANIEKNLNTDLKKKTSDNLSLLNTPKNLRPKKAVYSSNRNLTNIKISSQAVDNKDIHLEMNGKQETIINYTNQEMVKDEIEYMVECLKVLQKLDKTKQPRCRSKVDFNWENSNKKKIALFDLDETLVHCVKDKKGLNGDTVNIKLPTNKVVNVGLNIRPHWKEAIDLIKNHYHIVIYTASHQSYADAVLDYLDKENKYFQYRLYRNHCVQCDVDGIKFYVKDLDTLNEKYNLKDVVLIDNSVLSFAYHLNNGIPIVPFIEQKDDTQLIMLAYYLVSIANFDDLTKENKKHINIEHYLSQYKDLIEEDDENDGGEEENNEEDKNESKNNENINLNNNNEKNIENNTSTNGDEKEIKDRKENDEIKMKAQIKKQTSIESKAASRKLTDRKSQKALEIANDMKKNMNDVYNKKYN